MEKLCIFLIASTSVYILAVDGSNNPLDKGKSPMVGEGSATIDKGKRPAIDLNKEDPPVIDLTQDSDEERKFDLNEFPEDVEEPWSAQPPQLGLLPMRPLKLNLSLPSSFDVMQKFEENLRKRKAEEDAKLASFTLGALPFKQLKLKLTPAGADDVMEKLAEKYRRRLAGEDPFGGKHYAIQYGTVGPPASPERDDAGQWLAPVPQTNISLHDAMRSMARQGTSNINSAHTAEDYNYRGPFPSSGPSTTYPQTSQA